MARRLAGKNRGGCLRRGPGVSSYRVNSSTVALVAFDVVGEDGDPRGFIRHTGLAESTGTHQSDSVAVFDMGPPLHARRQMKADAVGSADLSDDEARKIQTFVDRHEGDHRAIQELNRTTLPQAYCIVPHASPFCENDGRYVRMRFSCSGFVFEAYRRARIRLVDEKALPKVGIEIIRSAYPRETRLMDRGRINRDSLGLTGEGPWPVMLCGYLFHALNRNAAAIRRTPYTPARGDEVFSTIL